MRVTATHLVSWSDQRVAQGMLPLMVRRLINATARIKSIAMPGGDSVNEPGWDGILNVESGNAWVPDGYSYWEFGTSKNPVKKAREDFNKRIKEMPAEQAAESAFVFVTSRRWREKGKWQKEARNKNVWKDILVWDADDLEAWLETSASSSLWTASQLGIAGAGVASIEDYWEHWSGQSTPTVTFTTLVKGREKARDDFLTHIGHSESLIAVMADSQSEAVGFICGMLIESGHSQKAVCVTSIDGWQFVDSNTGLEIVVTSNNQLASHRAPKKGMSMIIPLAFGDEAFNLMGAAAKAADSNVIALQRPRPDEFEHAVIDLGIAPSDAARYTRTLGRSWTVFRRMHALNPAIRMPEWVDSPNASSLRVLTLVGAWRSNSQGDKVCIEQIANRPYEEIETELAELVLLDDAPVLKIGKLWKAKAPLELLNLIGPKLTSEVLSRFFQVALAAFEEPDPVLELEDDKRWMATIYGKVREQSGVVLDAMADSIAKLGYFAETDPDLDNIGYEVRAFVGQLLANASEDRWLSISKHLKSFAEAAPDEYLSAIQDSLRGPGKTVTRLITETQSSGTFGRCWHANLLWSLEMLAWYPRRLIKVAEILAQLADTEVKGNWSNTPFRSLVSLFRPWLPQTAATLEHRISVVRKIVERFPQIGWRLLLALAPNHHDMAMANAKPHWRDDDAGAGDTVTDEEYRGFVLKIAKILVDKAQENPMRIAELVPLIDRLDIEFRDKVIGLVNASRKFQDEGKELVRSAVREFLSWENSYNTSGEKHDRYVADALRPTFDVLAPDDLVIRHAWIFSNGWVELPDGEDEDYEEVERLRADLRANAIREIFESRGWQGIDQLLSLSGDPRLIGWGLNNELFDRKELIEWLCNRYLNLSQYSYDSFTTGVLHAIPEVDRHDFLVSVIAELERRNVQSIVTAGLLSNAPEDMSVWSLVEGLLEDVHDQFWSITRPHYVRELTENLIYCVEKLLSANRPRTAFEALGDKVFKVSGSMLIKILNGISAGHESDAPLPRSWHISRMFKAISSDVLVPRSELVGLEFAYYEILRNGEYGTPALFENILSSPESFMELICMAYKPRHSEPEPTPENMQGAVQTASSILYHGRGTPGRDSDGNIDSNRFLGWIKKVRELASEHDRSAITDSTIGAWLSDWPFNKSLDVWPEVEIAELLDQEDCEDVRRGFSSGVRNSRGISSRSPYDGGNQERAIADKFKSFAADWTNEKPNVAAMSEDIAKSFEYDARHHDTDALWTQEA